MRPPLACKVCQKKPPTKKESARRIQHVASSGRHGNHWVENKRCLLKRIYIRSALVSKCVKKQLTKKQPQCPRTCCYEAPGSRTTPSWARRQRFPCQKDLGACTIRDYKLHCDSSTQKMASRGEKASKYPSSSVLSSVIWFDPDSKGSIRGSNNTSWFQTESSKHLFKRISYKSFSSLLLSSSSSSSSPSCSYKSHLHHLLLLLLLLHGPGRRTRSSKVI